MTALRLQCCYPPEAVVHNREEVAHNLHSQVEKLERIGADWYLQARC